MVSTERMKPRIMEPPSPMKMDAGGKLKQRKPRTEPMKVISRAAMNHWPLKMAAMRKERAQMKATPAERPSMLSRKLNALVRATIQSTDKMNEGTKPSEVK